MITYGRRVKRGYGRKRQGELEFQENMRKKYIKIGIMMACTLAVCMLMIVGVKGEKKQETSSNLIPAQAQASTLQSTALMKEFLSIVQVNKKKLTSLKKGSSNKSSSNKLTNSVAEEENSEPIENQDDSPYVIDPNKPMIALTYDDGPYSPVTERILDALEEYGGRATFFVVGNRVKTYESSIKRAYELGCEIGNHTYGHDMLTKLSNKEMKNTVNSTNNTVKEITGVSPKLLRPTGGAYNETVSKNIKMPFILWSIDTEDWKYRNKQHVIDAISSVKDGDIILMHDLYSTTADASEVVIPALVEQGFQLVTVSELFEYRKETLKSGAAYRHTESKIEVSNVVIQEKEKEKKEEKKKKAEKTEKEDTQTIPVKQPSSATNVISNLPEKSQSTASNQPVQRENKIEMGSTKTSSGTGRVITEDNKVEMVN